VNLTQAPTDNITDQTAFNSSDPNPILMSSLLPVQNSNLENTTYGYIAVGSLAAKFESFFSRLFGKHGAPFSNQAGFFFVTGLVTVILILLLFVPVCCIVKWVRKRQQKKARELVESHEEDVSPA
jgi:hypothetical protein